MRNGRVENRPPRRRLRGRREWGLHLHCPFSRLGLEEAFTGLHFALPARSKRCRAQSVGFFSPALLWWFLTRVHAAWGRGGGRAWPGLARGRGGGVVAMSGQVPRLPLRAAGGRRDKLGGMVSPALFPCGRTGSAREDLRTRTMSSVAANANVQFMLTLVREETFALWQGRRVREEGRIHSNHRTCFFLESSWAQSMLMSP